MGLFVEKKSGGKTAALLSGLGIGAALMYLLDPERGRLRRAMARDKALSVANKTGDVLAKRSRDIGNRAKGVAAEVRSAFAGVESLARDFAEPEDFSRPPDSAAKEASGRRESQQMTGEEPGRREPQQMSGKEPGRRVEEEGEL